MFNTNYTTAATLSCKVTVIYGIGGEVERGEVYGTIKL
jgi:hypothetical protein